MRPSIKSNQEVVKLNNLNEIPIKTPNEQWTDEQWQAIHASGSDMLVAAAAGSGKTAVLVQRIIDKVISKENPINIDRLLVLTFTNAAAAEMRSRINDALEKELLRDPSSAHLRRQVSLMNKAQISTLHSFCIEIVRSHFYKLDMDPKFKIANESDTALLLEESIEELLETEYASSNNTTFLRAVDSFSSDRSDDQFAKMLVDVYRASLSHPSPFQWLNGLVTPYQLSDDADITDLQVYPIIKQDIIFYLHAAVDRLKLAIEICNQGEGLEAFITTLLNDIDGIEQILQSLEVDWQKSSDLMAREIFKRAPSIKGDCCDVVAKDKVTALRKEAKNYVVTVSKMYFERDSKGSISDIREMGSVISTIAELVKKLHEIFTTAKSEKNIVDFNDLEHLALQVLTSVESGQFKPTDAAIEYQNYFVEVLVDEYQDTNNVQETIIQAIKKPTEKDGNLFMVGDVKQSIYRFRLADPSLFLNKYQTFEHVPSDHGLVIDLNKNFRSRKEVLDGTNYIFKQIMNKTVGEIDYDAAASLYYGAIYPDENAIELNLIDKGIANSQSHSEESTEDENHFEFEEEDLSSAQLEAKEMANRIRKMMDDNMTVYDTKLGEYRPLNYRDIVILHRSKSWYGEISEEFKKQGIPVYAELGKGYFATTEVSIIMSLLKIIDNPYQDIPLVAVLRSPLIGLNSEKLAEIRLAKVRAPFYEALLEFNKISLSNNIVGKKIERFLKRLENWIHYSKNNSVSSLIWEIYRETNYLDFVLGLPNGSQLY
ncbi:MAG: addA [Bacillales bacterium]|nr:addA [Bacillales bacterium]